MVIDLRQCIGCQACTVTCAQTNDVTLEAWRQVPDLGVAESPDRQRTFLPISCMQCSDAPCLEVCPTTATFRRDDGIVDINYDLCIGCGYCIVACPYLARVIAAPHELAAKMSNDAHEPAYVEPGQDITGVCTKCNFCLPRVDAGLAQGLQPGVDAEATPACVVSCTAQALHFGDMEDPQSVVSTLIRENNTAQILEELGTDPAINYIVE